MRPSREDGLLADRAGAILVIGVFIAPFLVGAIYYLVACSTVITQREGLQQAADAAAFAPSVASARGMNIIAVMNILMMCITSIMIPIRALLTGYAIVASLPCYYDACLCQIVADAQRASPELRMRSMSAERRAEQLLEALSNAQDAIAEDVPPSAKLTAITSARRTPAFLAPRLPEVYSPSLEGEGCRKGLPVEDDTFTTVCARTRPYVWEVALRIAGPETLNTMGSCLSGPMAIGFASIDLLFPENPRVCTEARNRPCSGNGPHPKKVVRGAKNGSAHMAWWVKVEGNEFDAPRTGVEVASNRKTGRRYDPALDIGFAQSEFFFDCNGGWGSSSCNRDEGAMWDTKWTARLRRVHVPDISFSNDDVVKNELASASHWQDLRQPLVDARRDFTTGNTAGGDSASLLTSSSEGPLQ